MKLCFCYARLLILMISAVPVYADNVFVTLEVSAPDEVNNTFEATLTASGYVTVPSPFGEVQVDIGESDFDVTRVSGHIDAGLVIDVDEMKNATVSQMSFIDGDLAMTSTEFVFDYGVLGSLHIEDNDIAGYPGTFVPGIADVTGTAFNVSEHYVVINQGTSSIFGTGLASDLVDISRDYGAEPSGPGTIDGQGGITLSYEYSDGYLDYYSVEMIIPFHFSQVVYDEVDPDEDYDIQIDLVATGRIHATGSFAVSSCEQTADIAGGDCIVDVNDLMVMGKQWLASSEVLPCPLEAELGGNDCVVNLMDYAVLASQWILDHE